jgi:hypothetical protein
MQHSVSQCNPIQSKVVHNVLNQGYNEHMYQKSKAFKLRGTTMQLSQTRCKANFERHYNAIEPNMPLKLGSIK